jgi:hypothetical protein
VSPLPGLHGKGRGSLAVFFLLLGILAGSASAAETGVVDEVVDGDTLRVRTAGNAEAVTVRLIGIDAPERSHPSLGKEFFSDEAASHLASLCGGKTVRMEKDEEETDKYDRLLRYVFLPPPDGRLLNEEMPARDGLPTRGSPSQKDVSRRRGARRREDSRRTGMTARWLAAGTLLPSRCFLRKDPSSPQGPQRGVERGDLLMEIEGILQLRGELSDTEFASKARDRGFRPIDPSKESPTKSGSPGQRALQPAPTVRGTIIPWEDAHRHQGEEIVVEGTIVRTHRAKNMMYLNFHANWKRYLTLVIFVKDLPLFPGNPETAYKGKKVRVRGEVKLYKDRLEMVVRSPGDITVVP